MTSPLEAFAGRGPNIERFAQRWLANLSMSRIVHGFTIVEGLANGAPAGPIDGDIVLGHLERGGWIERGKKETWFAKEIAFFDIERMNGPNAPVLFVWLPTAKLDTYISTRVRAVKTVSA